MSIAVGSVSPWQNPFAESFNGRLRDELLAVEQFHTLREATIMAEGDRQQCNKHRPHSSLGVEADNTLMAVWSPSDSRVPAT